MDTIFPTAIVSYIQAFASTFAASNFHYFRGFTLAFLLPGETRKCVTKCSLLRRWSMTSLTFVRACPCLRRGKLWSFAVLTSLKKESS